MKDAKVGNEAAFRVVVISSRKGGGYVRYTTKVGDVLYTFLAMCDDSAAAVDFDRIMATLKWGANYFTSELCSTCGGNGMGASTRVVFCGLCLGTGSIGTPGRIGYRGQCPQCMGNGGLNQKVPCADCKGEGRQIRKKRYHAH